MLFKKKKKGGGNLQFCYFCMASGIFMLSCSDGLGLFLQADTIVVPGLTVGFLFYPVIALGQTL